MNTKGFLLLIVTVVVIGGSIGGAFSGGLALGRAQSDDAVPETAFFQQRFGGGQISGDGVQGSGLPGGGSITGGFQGGQFGGPTSDGPPISVEGESLAGQDAPTGFRGGALGGRGGFGGILTGTVSTVGGNVFTVTTDTGETQVNLEDGSIIQVYAEGTASDLSSGDRVLVIVSGDIESGEPVSAVSVVVNPPEGGGIFGGGGFGGGQFGGRQRTP